MSDIQINFSIDDPITTTLTVADIGNVNLTVDSNIAANMSIDGVTYIQTFNNTAVGPSGAIQFSDGNSNFAGNVNLRWNNSESVLTIVNPENTDNQTAQLELVDYYANATFANTDTDITIAHARGNRASPANIEVLDDTLRITGWGYVAGSNGNIDGQTGWAQSGSFIIQRWTGNLVAGNSIPSQAVISVGNGNGPGTGNTLTTSGFTNFTFNSNGVASASQYNASVIQATTGNITTINSTSQINGRDISLSGNLSFSNNQASYLGNPKTENLTFVDYNANAGFDYDMVFFSARGNRASPQPVQVNDSLFIAPGFAYTGNGTLAGPDGQANGWAFTSHHIEVQVSEQPTVAGGCPSTKMRWTVSNATANNNFYKSIEFDHTGQTTLPGFTLNQGNLQVVGNITANNIGNITPINLNGNGLQVLSGNGSWAPLAVSNIAGLDYATETVSLVTNTTGVYNFDALDSSIKYNTSNATANITLNVRGNSTTTLDSMLSVGESITVTYVTNTGSIGYAVVGLQTDGSNQIVRYAGGISPALFANSIVSHTFTIVKTSSTPTYTVLGSQTRYA